MIVSCLEYEPAVNVQTIHLERIVSNFLLLTWDYCNRKYRIDRHISYFYRVFA